MLFKFKQKPIVVDCFTSDKAAFELAPIAPVSKFKPKWWKSLDRGGQNVRACPAFVNIYQHGFVIPCPIEYSVVVKKIDEKAHPEHYLQEKFLLPDRDPIGIWVTSGKDRFGFESPTHFHPVEHSLGWKSSTHRNLKILTGWRFCCSEYVKFYMAPMTWDDYQEDDYFVTSGLIDFKYNHSTNIHTWIDIRKEHEFVIPMGRPMQHIIPLTERPIKLNLEWIPEIDMDRKAASYFQGNMISRGYQKMVGKLEGRF